MTINLASVMAQLDEGTKALLQVAIDKAKAKAEEAEAAAEAKKAEDKRQNELAGTARDGVKGIMLKGQPRLQPFLDELYALGWKGIKIVIPQENYEAMIISPGVREVAPKGPSNGRGGKRVPLTVDGTEYASAAAAHRAVLGEMANAMNRAAITSALTSAGHTVS